MAMGFPFGVVKMPWNSRVSMGAQDCECTRCRRTVHSNMEDFCYVFFFCDNKTKSLLEKLIIKHVCIPGWSLP